MTDISALTDSFSALEQLDEAAQRLLAQAQKVEIPADQVVFHQGDACNNYILVVSGTVRVVGRHENGREIVLYRIEDKGSCVLTTSCLLGGEAYPAEGITETDVTAYLVPLPVFQQALAESDQLRRFIFDSYGERLSRMIALVQDIAFERIEKRLARYLIEHCGPGYILFRSHQEIADELGTAREVVSRQLKTLEQKAWISLSRNQIMFLNKEAIRILGEE